MGNTMFDYLYGFYSTSVCICYIPPHSYQQMLGLLLERCLKHACKMLKTPFWFSKTPVWFSRTPFWFSRTPFWFSKTPFFRKSSKWVGNPPPSKLRYIPFTMFGETFITSRGPELWPFEGSNRRRGTTTITIITITTGSFHRTPSGRPFPTCSPLCSRGCKLRRPTHMKCCGKNGPNCSGPGGKTSGEKAPAGDPRGS